MDRNDPSSSFSTLTQFRRWRIALRSVVLLEMLLACKISGAPTPSVTPTPVTKADLVGTWEGNYPSSPRGTEVIILNDDGTYKQFYEDTAGYSYAGEGSWSLVQFASGRQRVLLEGGLWFPEGAEVAKLRGADPKDSSKLHAFWDSNTLEPVYMPNGLVLEVIPSGYSKGFALMQYAYGIKGGLEHLRPVTRGSLP